ncbi:MAG TPA: hypothetical protein ENN36_09470 [Candidatus Bathyarchaeota archaeon]|nr:hypothetical protein [Candidatus Bathyarchaeota archaeon]
MASNRFFKLIVWEFEQFLNFPILEFLIASTLFLVLFQPITNHNFFTIWENLNRGNSFLVIFMIFIVCAVFSRSFAGTLDRGEIKMLLSYPIKRWELFSAKFITQFFVLSAIIFVIFSFNIPLMGLNPFNPMLYASLLGLLLHLLVVCSVTTTVSLLIKKETITILVSAIPLFGLETIGGRDSFFTGIGRSNLIFDFFKQSIAIGSESVAFGDFVLAVAFPIVISAFLLLISLIYFSFIMEVD